MMADEVDEFLCEAAMLAKLRHPNVCMFYGIGVKSDTLYLVQEYCDGGSLRDFRKFSGYDHRKHTAKFMLQLFKTLHYLHSRAIPVIHRDIKPDNLLIHAGSILKVGDLGTSREQGTSEEEQMMTQNAVGTVHYMPSEALQHVYRDKRDTCKPIDGRKWDVYSCGLCVLFAYTGVDPFAQFSSLTVVRKVLDDDMKPTIGREVPKTLHSLIKDMWATNPSQRPTMKDATNRLEKALRHETKLAPPTPKTRLSSASIKSSSMEKQKRKASSASIKSSSMEKKKNRKSSAVLPSSSVASNSTTEKQRPPSVPVIKIKEKKGPSVPPPTKPTDGSTTKKRPPSVPPPIIKKKTPPSPPKKTPPKIKKKKRKKKKKKSAPAIPPLPSQS